MNEQEIITLWDSFAQKTQFMLNPDKEHVNIVAKGVLNNGKKFGLKLCPCRIRDGSFEKDLQLICPCNFFIHDTWLKPKNKEPMCWCGLFVKK